MTNSMLPDTERFLSSMGLRPPDLHEIEVFHETTKLFACHALTMGRRVGEYLVNPRAVKETANNRKVYRNAPVLPLNAPRALDLPFGQTLDLRHSERTFIRQPLSLDDLSTLLSCLQVTRTAVSDIDPDSVLSFRRYPSGGGLYPVETYLLLLNVEGVAPCLAHYEPLAHVLRILGPLPDEKQLTGVFMDHGGLLKQVSLVAVSTALFERSVVKYGPRGYRFSIMEAGTVGYLLSLAATAMNLGSLHWGGYYDDQLATLLGVDGVTEAVLNCLFVGAASNAE